MRKSFTMFALYKQLPKSMFAFFFASIVNSLGHFVHPFLTFFLSEKAGLPDSATGTILTIAALAYLPGSLLAGRFADKTGRKKIYLGAFASAGLCLVPCAFLGTSLIIPGLIILSSFFYGMTVPCHTAMLMDLAPKEKRKGAFSLIYLGHNIGFSVGALVAGFLYRHHMKLLFLGDAATTLLAVLIVIIFVPETIPSRETMKASIGKEDGERAEKGHVLKVLLSRPFLLVFILLMPIYSFVYSQLDFSLPLFASHVFGEKGSIVFGSLMTVNTLVVVILTVPIIALTRNLKPLLNIVLTGCLYAAGFGMLYFAHSVFIVYLSTFVWTAGEILAATNVKVYVANHTPITHRARLNAVTPLFIEGGRFLGPVIMGAFIVSRSVRMVWPLVFFLSLAAAVALLLLFLIENGRSRKVGEKKTA